MRATESLLTCTAEARLKDFEEARDLKDVTQFGLIAELDGEPAGVVIGSSLGWSVVKGAIELVPAIAERKRRQGIGTLLLEEASAIAAEAGFTDWYLYFPEEYGDSVAWANASGFEQADLEYHLIFDVADWDEEAGGAGP